MQAIPSRVSDAGPVDQPKGPERWDEHVDAAVDELSNVGRLFRDDLRLQRKLRLECLDRAQMALDQARVLVEAQRGFEAGAMALPEEWEH